MSLPLASESVTLRRPSGGAWNSSGAWSGDSTADTTITASVQPFGARELQLLPEGWRSRQPRKIYTETELRTVDQHGETSADRIVDTDTVVYLVMSVERQRTLVGLAHYKGTLLRLDEASS